MTMNVYGNEDLCRNMKTATLTALIPLKYDHHICMTPGTLSGYIATIIFRDPRKERESVI
jgi:hypothetical protein